MFLLKKSFECKGNVVMRGKPCGPDFADQLRIWQLKAESEEPINLFLKIPLCKLLNN